MATLAQIDTTPRYAPGEWEARVDCQPARDLDPGSASNIDPAMVSVGVG